MKNTHKSRLVAAVGAVALGAMTLMGSSAAFAAPQTFGNIDQDREGSLTVHKFLHQDGTTEGDISEAPAEGAFSDPVADVEFTAYPLQVDGENYDLSAQENWNDIADLIAGTPGAECIAPEGFTLGDPIVLPLTGADGSATVTLPVGLYQVCETAAPANIVDRALPFILTVPMPHEGGWVYDVHAYPKNGEGEIVKSISPQQDFGLGSVVEFPVTVPVPTMQDEWTGFAIRDTFDDRLTPVAAEDVAVTLDGAALDASFYEVLVDGQTVTMNFTAAGIAWLNEEPDHAGKEITVFFAGTVVAIGEGVITNQAELWPNNPGFDPDKQPPLPSNEVRTHWGELEVLKRAAGTEGAEGTLEGAMFEVYPAAAPYADTCEAVIADGAAPINVAGETQFTSDANGIVTVSGLFVSDSVNPAIDAEIRCYVLKEIAAPAGYVLPEGDAALTAVGVSAGESTAVALDIENTQQSVPKLPITGGSGTFMMIAAGVGGIAIALGLMLMKRRRNAEEVSA